MDKRTYNFAVGLVLLIAAVGFFIMPGFLRIDALIPVMLAFISFIVALVFFFMGYSEK